nr:ferredoxin, root R-B1 [Tanacetum cinerariifolium]
VIIVDATVAKKNDSIRVDLEDVANKEDMDSIRVDLGFWFYLRHCGKIVLQQMHQSLNGCENSLGGCIQKSVVTHPESGCTSVLKESLDIVERSDNNTHSFTKEPSPRQSKGSSISELCGRAFSDILKASQTIYQEELAFEEQSLSSTDFLKQKLSLASNQLSKYIQNEDNNFNAPDDCYILDTTDNAGIEMPYLCRTGACLLVVFKKFGNAAPTVYPLDYGHT